MSEVKLLFGKLTEVFHNKRSDQARTTNFVFRLHGKLTSTILILASALIFIQHYITKSHMSCLVPSDEDIRSSALNQYCFITGTYTVPNLYESQTLTAHIGVGPQIKDKDERKMHHYFQWVPFVLIIQGILFHLPYLIWKCWENDLINSYCNLQIGENVPLKSRTFLSSLEGDKTNRAIKNVGIYIVKSLGFNKSYSTWYLFCEFLNLIVVLLSFYTTDFFLSGQFQNYGIEWLRYSKLKQKGIEVINPMDKIFPKVSKCEFQKFGPSGSIMNYDILCILTLNIVNEKIYLVLWFWWGILFIMGLMCSTYRFILILFPPARTYLMQKRSVRREERQDLKQILKKMSYADWFVLKKISDNLDRLRFGDLCKAIRNAMNENKKKPTIIHHEVDCDGQWDQEIGPQFTNYNTHLLPPTAPPNVAYELR